MRAGERVYSDLRAEIVDGRLAPGSVLGEVEQAARLGVSRTPLREALSRLAAEGLAVVGKGRTLVVSRLDADDVTHLFELREALETQAARLAAARRADPATFADLAERFTAAAAAVADGDPSRVGYYTVVADLDAAVDDAMASPYLRRSLASLRAHAARARRLSRDNPDRLVRAAHEHQLIAAAIADGDATLAAQATAVHLRASLTSILRALAEAPAGQAAAPVPAATPVPAPAATPVPVPATPGAAR
ncbi:GntR family transcriptional regulator [Georgenia sp. TF02-10]|uniref:GntR family transcriptional regulator n=1 Tax=Georgenia sp. TF02-10 TaxID=2917725 RepID=UPI001FA72423|nr:GntR family transcriptional regulator [Georgenia sp. TF02-10]UNX54502.1 GntR family transcriptional regulator [Georgenia sp. TF02-10]